MSWEIGVGTIVVVKHKEFKDSPLYEGIIIAETEQFYKVRRTSGYGGIIDLFPDMVPAKEEWLKKDRVEPLV